MFASVRNCGTATSQSVSGNWLGCSLATAGWSRASRRRYPRSRARVVESTARAHAAPDGAGVSALDLRDLMEPIVDASREVIDIVKAVRQEFGPELPSDIRYDRDIRSKDKALRDKLFWSNYDEGYCGHFSVQDDSILGAAADFETVFSERDPFEFVRKHLYFYPASGVRRPGRDVVVFGPGLNTLHAAKQDWPNETTTPQRLQHYVDVLQRPMAQLHVGTDMDQGGLEIPDSPALRKLLDSQQQALKGAGIWPDFGNGRITFTRRARDKIETVLAQVGLVRPMWQRHLIKMLELNESVKRPLVFFPFSRSTSELASALRKYVGDASKRGSREKAEEHLRETLTVVTFGNADRNFPDGPAYVHIAAMSDRREGGTDLQTRDSGVTAKRPDGAGADCVFIHYDGIWAKYDSHNFAASGAHALRLVLEMNDCMELSLRALWEKGRRGELVIPSKEQVEAMVKLKDGDKWLWVPDQAYNGVDLPSESRAKKILKYIIN